LNFSQPLKFEFFLAAENLNFSNPLKFEIFETGIKFILFFFYQKLSKFSSFQYQNQSALTSKAITSILFK